jgi:hypothetical protein
MRQGLIGVVVVAASLVAVSSAATGGPVLQRAAPLGGHVVVTFSTNDLVPGRVQFATTPATGPTGAFPAGSVRLRESIKAQAGEAGLVRWKTRASLPKGTYYVEVSGFLTGGVTSCIPLRGNCLERWSNVRRVVVR